MESRFTIKSAVRTGGDIYIGVVGPVRTGKSTFIKRFMETMVLPDGESPQAGRAQDGAAIRHRTDNYDCRTKFVPEEAAEIALPEGGACRVRLDCVVYLVEAHSAAWRRYTAHGIYTVAGGNP